jgi:hypothetical protein
MNKQKLKLVKKLVSWNHWRNHNPEVYELDHRWDDKKIYKTFGVNWAAMGTQHPGKAGNYAKKLKDATALANALNRAKIKKEEYRELYNKADSDFYETDKISKINKIWD